jgi:hypothetical protein
MVMVRFAVVIFFWLPGKFAGLSAQGLTFSFFSILIALLIYGDDA